MQISRVSDIPAALKRKIRGTLSASEAEDQSAAIRDVQLFHTPDSQATPKFTISVDSSMKNSTLSAIGVPGDNLPLGERKPYTEIYVTVTLKDMERIVGQQLDADLLWANSRSTLTGSSGNWSRLIQSQKSPGKAVPESERGVQMKEKLRQVFTGVTNKSGKATGVSVVTYQSNGLHGEAAYNILTPNDFSRENFERLGLIVTQDPEDKNADCLRIGTYFYIPH